MMRILSWLVAGLIASCLVELSIRMRNAMAYAGYLGTAGSRRRE
jgi:hypothetical protein